MNFIAKIKRWWVLRFKRSHPYCRVCRDDYEDFCKFCVPMDKKYSIEVASTFLNIKFRGFQGTPLTIEEKGLLNRTMTEDELH